ncbi:MAG: hypothetical protein MJ093_00385 [Saccharofermentans sp.]|nr:hypothetical protein [Saccharofermentans sp.]
MRFENDDILHDCFIEELEKIPKFLRCGRKKMYFFMVLCGAWLIADLIIAAIPTKKPEIIWIKNSVINFPFALPSESFKTLTLMNIILLLLLIWLETCDLLERRAFRIATEKATRINQHNKEIERWDDLKKKEKLEKAMRELEIEESQLKPKQKFCKKCGFLLPEDPDNLICRTCGTDNKE